MRELERLVDQAKRYGEPSAMLFVDLDGLKMINDTFGHKAGDGSLIQVAGLLVGGVRRSDVVARIGGDEFGILLAHADEANAHETAARLTDLICRLRVHPRRRRASAERGDRGGGDRRRRRAGNDHGPRRRGNVPKESGSVAALAALSCRCGLGLA